MNKRNEKTQVAAHFDRFGRYQSSPALGINTLNLDENVKNVSSSGVENNKGMRVLVSYKELSLNSRNLVCNSIKKNHILIKGRETVATSRLSYRLTKYINFH